MNIKKVVFPDVAVFVFSAMVILAAGLYQSPNVLAQSNNNGIIDLNQPLYSEHFKLTSQKEDTINGTKVTEGVFSGNGTAKGISIISTGKGLIFPRPGGVVYIKGKADFIAIPSPSSDKQTGKATYTFQTIGNYGVALFNANATGSLSFLSNVIVQN